MRRFAAWRSAADPLTEIPPAGLRPHRYRRKPPHIYSDDEIARLLHAAAALPSANGLRAPTSATFFGLLAVTSMRVSEALKLDRPDVDLREGILTIRLLSRARAPQLGLIARCGVWYCAPSRA